jgi:LysM repeat protein
MQIHTTEEGQTIKEISKIYTVDEDLIRAVNKIEGKPTVGEEILILTPSRSYRVQYGDTADKISLRFGTRESVLAAMNPHVSTEKLQQGEILAIK